MRKLLFLGILLLSILNIDISMAQMFGDGGSGFNYGKTTSTYDMQKEVIYFIIVLFLFILFFKKIKSFFSNGSDISISGLVLTKYILNKDSEDILIIEGRKGGIWNFIMSKLKIENKTSFIVNQKNKTISFSNSNLNGNTQTLLLTKDISSINVGYYKNLVLVIFVGIILFTILFSLPVIAVIGAVVLAIYYYINKNVSLEFESSGGRKINISFSTSVIENLNMDIKKAKEIQDIIFELKLI